MPISIACTSLMPVITLVGVTIYCISASDDDSKQRHQSSSTDSACYDRQQQPATVICAASSSPDDGWKHLSVGLPSAHPPPRFTFHPPASPLLLLLVAVYTPAAFNAPSPPVPSSCLRPPTSPFVARYSLPVTTRTRTRIPLTRLLTPSRLPTPPRPPNPIVYL